MALTSKMPSSIVSKDTSNVPPPRSMQHNCSQYQVKDRGHKELTENEDIALARDLFIQTVRDGGCRRLIDDSQDVKARNHASVFSGLTLRVVEISRHGDDGVGDGRAKVSFRCFSHFQQDHGRNLFWRELSLLATVLDLDDGLVTGFGDDFKGPLFYLRLHFGV